ncbi:MAG TPA: hypothetical protein VMG12_41105 [Polyangiaceae bacterium]|nr:hypothetical protein [Polyangiaceae bacterium]
MKTSKAIAGIACAALFCGIAAQADASIQSKIFAEFDGTLPGEQALKEFSPQGLTVRSAIFKVTEVPAGFQLRVNFIAGLDRASLVGLTESGQTLPNCSNSNDEQGTTENEICTGGTPFQYALVIN